MKPWQVPGDTWQEKLATWLGGMDAPTEADTAYDGVLSYSSEAHAAILGLVLGFTLGIPGLVLVVATALGLKRWNQISNRKAVKELKHEPWYGIGASLIGYGGHQLLNLPSYIPHLVQSLPF